MFAPYSDSPKDRKCQVPKLNSNGTEYLSCNRRRLLWKTRTNSVRARFSDSCRQNHISPDYKTQLKSHSGNYRALTGTRPEISTTHVLLYNLLRLAIELREPGSFYIPSDLIKGSTCATYFQEAKWEFKPGPATVTCDISTRRIFVLEKKMGRSSGVSNIHGFKIAH